MGLQRSIWKPKKEPKIPPKRTALTRRRPPNCAKTVRGLVLATPDELENDNMRVGKLRSSSTTSEHTQDDQQKHQTSISRFTALRGRGIRRTTQIEPQSDLQLS